MNSLLVISSYPHKKTVHGRTTVGVASYAKNTFLAIKNIAPKSTKITILAEKLKDDKDHSHQGIEVKRIWSRESLLAFPKIIKEIVKNYQNTKTVVVELELAMFGSLVYLLPLPLFLLTLRILRKKVILVNHQVLPTIEEIAPHINIEGQSFKAMFLSVGLKIFYTLMMLLSHKVIVFEEVLKQKLSHFGNSKKISVIPHGVENFESKLSKVAARKKLGIKRQEFVVVSFGYLAWYKGTDWLVHTIAEIKKSKRNLGKNITLILAGGPNPNHLDKEYYSKYLASITKEAEKNGIQITGFVPQVNIPTYYKAADVIVLPYRTYMSSSGPLSMAFSFKKPFLLANNLSGVLHQKDVQELLHEYKIPEQSIIFKEDLDLVKALDKIRKNANLRNRLAKLSAGLAKKRDWKLVGRSYYDEIFA